MLKSFLSPPSSWKRWTNHSQHGLYVLGMAAFCPLPRPYLRLGRQMKYSLGRGKLSPFNLFSDPHGNFNHKVWGLLAQFLPPFASLTLVSPMSPFPPHPQTFPTVNWVLSCALRRPAYAMGLGTTPVFAMIIENTPLLVVVE